MHIHAYRVNEYDIILTAPAGQGAFLNKIAKAFRKRGAHAWKLGERAYQISLHGHPEMRKTLPTIGTKYTIQL